MLTAVISRNDDNESDDGAGHGVMKAMMVMITVVMEKLGMMMLMVLLMLWVIMAIKINMP